MSFLPDVYVTCDVCRGRRYNHETLQVKYKGYSIADLLDATVEEALGALQNIPQIKMKLQTLNDVGLGYIHLGQSSTTLSGGEAQRIKLAKELSKRQTGRTFYLLDEPTTGLHFDDVRHLLDVLQRLVDLGNTVLVIEHQLHRIRSADVLMVFYPSLRDDPTPLLLPIQVAFYGFIYLALYCTLRTRYGKPVFSSLGWRRTRFNPAIGVLGGAILAFAISGLAALLHTPQVP